jgi:hypothetical protein
MEKRFVFGVLIEMVLVEVILGFLMGICDLDGWLDVFDIERGMHVDMPISEPCL